jgi:4-hydroxybenzoyl-CoA thioesterase
MARGAREITLRFLAAPTDSGYSGTVGGGRVLEWIDKAGYAAAAGWSGTYSVTAYVGNVRFTRPVEVGDLVEATARVIHTGTTSMHILVRVSAGNPKDGDLHPTTDCIMVFVAVDENGKPTRVPQLVPEDERDREWQESAVTRIGLRNEIAAAMAAPTDVNWGGKVHGGIVMKWIDEAAYVCASRYCGRDTVAVFSGGVRFYRPLLIGHVVEVEARLVYTGTKGMHIAVHVRSGDPKGRELNLTTYCLTVMVARDDEGNSVPVPAWVPVSEEDKRLHAHARELLEIRGTAPGNRLPNHLLAAAGHAGITASEAGEEGS